jgi:pentatricopeptide repeat protein
MYLPKPNTFTYTAVIEAHANSGSPGSAARAAEICDTMVQKWDDGDPDVEPTSRCFNAAINAYAKSGEPDAAHQAESLFEQMIEVFEAGNDEVQT